VKIPAETLKQKTILFKLIDIARIGFHLLRETIFTQEQLMLRQNTSNRVLNRMGARELSPERSTTRCRWNHWMPRHFPS
jgi:hypothetical protein